MLHGGHFGPFRMVMDPKCLAHGRGQCACGKKGWIRRATGIPCEALNGCHLRERGPDVSEIPLRSHTCPLRCPKLTPARFLCTPANCKGGCLNYCSAASFMAEPACLSPSPSPPPTAPPPFLLSPSFLETPPPPAGIPLVIMSGEEIIETGPTCREKSFLLF